MNLDAETLTRRKFLRQKGCAALGLIGVMNTLAQLRMVHNASAHTQLGTNDYKALVCIFLYGGNDSNNTIIPYGVAANEQYRTDRGILGIDRGLLNQLSFTDAQNRTWGMHPNLADQFQGSPSAHSLFQTGKLAVVANVGTLVAPVNQAEYLSGNIALPPQLFSHSDQQLHWQSSIPDQPFSSGWGGRLADRMYGNNTNAQTSMSVSLAGHNDFMVGSELAATQLHLTADGPVRLRNYGNPINPDANNNNGRMIRAFDKIMGESMDNLFAEEYRNRVANARANNAFITDALPSDADLGATFPNFPAFPDTNLGGQLEIIAKMIAARDSLNQKRQIFFAAVGGFDTHGSQLGSHGTLMSNISTALGAFYQATVELGVENDVTAFTASDFNRTYTPNGTDAASAGSDHAWGGHAMVVGGSVTGQQIYGTMPNLTLGALDDTELTANGRVSRGRWIPSTSVDQYSATLAKWYGLTPAHLAEVFPNLGRFDNPDLGFLS